MRDVDLLVIGAGLAGLTAAACAAQAGRRVIVVEIAGEVGGSARFAGYAWTAPTRAVMDEVNPAGDRALSHALVDRFDEGIEWIRSLGVDCRDPVPILGFGRGHQFDTNQYIDTCRDLVIKAGGEVWLNARTRNLILDEDRVVGAEVERPDGTTTQLIAPFTMLATGGFQGDPELVRQHVRPRAGASSSLPLRSNPHSRGRGYRLGTAAGAATGPADAGFYGHLIPSGIDFEDPADFVDLSLYYSEHALLFSLDNQRFTDETAGDHLNTMALLQQPEGRGLLIADARVHRDWMIAAYVEGAASTDKFAVTNRRGGRCGLAESLPELAYLPAEWGYDGKTIQREIEEFNHMAAMEETLEPRRRFDSKPLDEGPWYVIETVPAITFPFHGIRIDQHARVLDHDGAPLPGLLCAGSDSGGLYHRAYAGGLAPALVFGLAAAETATT